MNIKYNIKRVMNGIKFKNGGNFVFILNKMSVNFFY